MSVGYDSWDSGQCLQHQEREHEPCDQVYSKGITEFIGRALGVRVNDAAAWDQNGGIAHPEGAVRREC